MQMLHNHQVRMQTGPGMRDEITNGASRALALYSADQLSAARAVHHAQSQCLKPDIITLPSQCSYGTRATTPGFEVSRKGSVPLLLVLLGTLLLGCC